MEKSTNKAAAMRMEDPAGALAVTLLAYNDMGADQEVERLLAETDRPTLGRAVAIWYQMCEQERGKTATAQAARIVADKLQNSLDGLDKNLPHDEYKRKGLPLSFGRGLLLHLATGEEERFTELWNAVSAITTTAVETSAVIMGFALSVLHTPTASYCE